MAVLDINREPANPHESSRAMHKEVLRVCDLSVNFRLDTQQESKVIRQVSFEIGHREIVGLLGESGCGKTTTALATLQLLPPSAYLSSGSIEFHGQSLFDLAERRLREIRGFQISIIYQDSGLLNPVMRAGDQVMEILRAHRKMTSAQMRDEVYSTLSAVGFEDCDRIFRAYPHQLSGGQRRRIAIAQALVCKPRLVIADEPTAWLDAKTTAETLALFSRLRDEYETAFLLISHDPDTLMAADRILVMYAGQIVESGSAQEVFSDPKHPYTRALMQCSTVAAGPNFVNRQHRLPFIPGRAPDPAEIFVGCSFASRCCDRMEVCDSRHPQLIGIPTGRAVRCLKYGDGV